MKTESIVKGKTPKQVNKLNLTGKNLTEIPSFVFEYTNLTKLVLSRNAIRRIPKEIASLRKLEVLEMTYNELTEIPAPVFKLPKLRVLAVGHNKLRKFPKQLVGSSVEQLIADHNQIAGMDAAALEGLSKLVLSYNPIGGQIIDKKLDKLKFFDFRHTGLDTPDFGMIPDGCKYYLPIHPASISPEMVATKLILDSSIQAEPEETTTKGTIFISHSSKDKKIIEQFVDEILQLGMGIPSDSIRCTSIEGMNIPNGEKMREWIQDNIRNCSVAFLMISPNYKKSEICLNEMGAVWALDKSVKILLLPDIDYGNFGWLEEIRQAGHIDSEGALDQLYDEMKQYGKEVKAAEWSRHKNKFLQFCKTVPAGAPEKETSTAENVNKVYLGYCSKIFDYLRYKSFPVWSEMVNSSRPSIPQAVLDDFDSLVSYLDSRADYSGYEQLNVLFDTLSILVVDFTHVMDLYAEGEHDYYRVRAFYKEETHNPNYFEDLEDYNTYVAFLGNMIFELNRVCNAILFEARKLQIDFMSDFGIFSIDGIGHEKNRVVRFVYKEGDMYKGLKDFITVAQSRDYYRPFDEIRIRRMLCDMLTQ